MESNYKRLGNYIKEIDVRNSDSGYSNLIGVSINKQFIPSVANIIGTDLSKYKIIEKNQFACSLMQVSRDGGIAISLYKDSNKAIMSPAYYIFEIIDDKQLMPEYLELIVYNPEFDREAVFNAIGGVRGTLTWEDFCDMKVNIPDITEQEKIVRQYKTITDRISVLEKINEKLELIGIKTLDNYLDENGNEYCPIFNYGEVITGKTPSMSIKEYYDKKEVPFIKTPDMHDGAFVVEYSEYISKRGADSQKGKYLPPMTVIMSCIGSAGVTAITTEEAQTNQQINAIVTKHPEIVYLLLKRYRDELLVLGDGSTTMININKTDFGNFKLPTFDKNGFVYLEKKLKPLFQSILFNTLEIKQLKEMKDLVLTKL